MGMTLRFELFPADLTAHLAFWTAVLGLEVVRDERTAPAPYVALVRDAVHVGALGGQGDRTEGRRPPVGVELVLEVDDVEAERARVAAAGWPVEEDMTERHWGLRDFRLLDPSGYYVRITDRG